MNPKRCQKSALKPPRISNGQFPPQGAGRFSLQRVALPPPKVAVTRTEPYWAALTVLHWGTQSLKGSRQVWDTHAANGESLVYGRKCLVDGKSLPSILDVLHCCSLCTFFFSQIYIRLHCVVLLWEHGSYVPAVAVAARLKPRPP